MTRARWILGSLGALAAVAFVPAAQAAPTPDEARFGTEITNSIDGSRWAVFAGDPVIKSVPSGAWAPTDKWVISDKFDGSVTIENQRTGRCAQADPWVGGSLLATPCLPDSPSQSWMLQPQADGYVITPRNAPDLVVSVQNANSPSGSWLSLEPRESENGFGTVDGGSVFRLGV